MVAIEASDDDEAAGLISNLAKVKRTPSPVFCFNDKTTACGVLLSIAMALLAVTYVGAVEWASRLAIIGFLKLDWRVNEFCHGKMDLWNLSTTIWFPGCESIGGLTAAEIASCANPCFSKELLDSMAEFNLRHPGELVSYSSRHVPGLVDAKLRGWWAPAPQNADDAPVIVLQHGFLENSNKHRMLVATFLLRRLGFNVLVNNLRDHCYSEDTNQHICQWGFSYPYDVLGAWDYVRWDPDGKLGGPRPKEKIGLYGMSMGAATILDAMGLEADVIAGWADSPPWKIETTLWFYAERALQTMGVPSLFAKILCYVIVPRVQMNLFAAAEEYGVDLRLHELPKTLPLGPETHRPLQWIGNRRDSTVPIEWGETLLEFLDGHKDKYNVSVWRFDGSCNGEDHCANHLQEPDLYSALLCNFWSDAMGLSDLFCRSRPINDVGNVTLGLPILARSLQPSRQAGL